MDSEALDALWSDGRASRVRPLRLSRVGSLLRGESADGEVREWPLADIRISPRLARTPRTLALPDGGRMELADAPLLDVWFPRAPSRMEALADWLERRRYAILASALLVVAGIIGFVQFGLPWGAHRIAERIPPSVEKNSSDQVVRILERFHVEASKLPKARQARLAAAFRELVAGEPRAGQMRLHLVDASDIGPNAFALPDGRIYLTDQLVELARNDDELLAVLAHEAGHHVHRHGMRGAIEGASVFVLAGLLLGDASGSSLAVSLPATLLSNGFSRDHEREADAYAFDLLKRRGRSPRDFATLMARLSQANGSDDGDIASFISTHPSSQARMRAAEQAAKP
ncbi:M48 family metallopeptidase [Solilutibacter pythonis]|uniref:M48 family metallopeptidase n=1 Tax=Solilutibacter pythonis TaxID=2483112 RepID=UPI001314E9DD|nr:M48 family metallopeptidase [Lysobacter pythonis]